MKIRDGYDYLYEKDNYDNYDYEDNYDDYFEESGIYCADDM